MKVKAVYNQALTLHIVALAMCCVMAAIFVFVILLPTVRRMANERRRVAELLSHVSHRAPDCFLQHIATTHAPAIS